MKSMFRMTLKPICKKLIFKRLLYKLTTDCTIQFNQNFYKQIDGCAMGGPLSVILADIHMVRTENEVVKPLNPPFYKRFVDDIYSRRNKSQQDVLFEALNNFHPNIKLTIEVNPEKCLDTKILLNNEGVVTTQVYRKENKKAVPWVSKIPKRYKRNTISGDLHRSRKIASNFDIEIRAIKAKYNKAGYPRRFIGSIIRDFITPLDKDESFIIPPNMFEVKKPFLLLEIPYCEQNEIASKRFIKKFHQFTGEKYDIAVKWLTKKVKSLFPLKDRNLHPSCKIYKGICSCGETYIDETIRNVEERWSEHNSADNKSEPAKHLADNKEHSFLWSILLDAPKDGRTRKNLEAFFIAKLKPSLNRQEDSNMLTLFRNGVT